MLRNLTLFLVYDSTEYDLIRDLQVPLLKNSIDYLRGVDFSLLGGYVCFSRYGRFCTAGGKS